MEWVRVTSVAKSLLIESLQGLAKRCAPGCVNAAGKLRGKW